MRALDHQPRGHRPPLVVVGRVEPQPVPLLLVLEHPTQHLGLALRLLAVPQQELALLLVEQDVEDARPHLQRPAVLQDPDLDLVGLDELAEVGRVLEEGENGLPALLVRALSGDVRVGVVLHQLGFLLLRLMVLLMALLGVLAVLFDHDVVGFLRWLSFID